MWIVRTQHIEVEHGGVRRLFAKPPFALACHSDPDHGVEQLEEVPVRRGEPLANRIDVDSLALEIGDVPDRVGKGLFTAKKKILPAFPDAREEVRLDLDGALHLGLSLRGSKVHRRMKTARAARNGERRARIFSPRRLGAVTRRRRRHHTMRTDDDVTTTAASAWLTPGWSGPSRRPLLGGRLRAARSPEQTNCVARGSWNPAPIFRIFTLLYGWSAVNTITLCLY